MLTITQTPNEIENPSNEKGTNRQLLQFQDLRFLSYYLAKGNYISRNRTKLDILNGLNAFPGLKLNFETFTTIEGAQKELICLLGTIPVTYK